MGCLFLVKRIVLYVCEEFALFVQVGQWKEVRLIFIRTMLVDIRIRRLDISQTGGYFRTSTTYFRTNEVYIRKIILELLQIY